MATEPAGDAGKGEQLSAASAWLHKVILPVRNVPYQLWMVRPPGDYEFSPDEIGYDTIDMRGVVGHKQAGAAYLAGLVRYRGGRLATLDRALAALYDDVALLLDADE